VRAVAARRVTRPTVRRMSVVRVRAVAVGGKQTAG
jgi:hypothetical protein